MLSKEEAQEETTCRTDLQLLYCPIGNLNDIFVAKKRMSLRDQIVDIGQCDRGTCSSRIDRKIVAGAYLKSPPKT